MRARRVRLLFVNPNRSQSFGGVERWMIDAASGLAARGHAAALLGRPGTPWLEAAARAGVPVRPDIRGGWAERVLRLAAAMRAEEADVVIVKGKKAARMAALGRATGARGGALVRGGGLRAAREDARPLEGRGPRALRSSARGDSPQARRAGPGAR